MSDDTATNPSTDDWCTIESDPAVFTELLETLGCSAVELQELWTLDDPLPSTVYGLIFLFQWDERTSAAPTQAPLEEDQIPPDLFFAHQVTTNACATQALLSVVLNTLQPNQLGETLSEFKTFTKSFPPSLKGVAISSSDAMKKAHNSFARPDAFWTDPNKINNPANQKGEAFHFVAYLPHQGHVYELDGLQKGPILVDASSTSDGTTSDGTAAPSSEDWTTVAKTALQQRMANNANVKFNLMAVIPSKLEALEQQIQEAAATDSSTDLLQTQLAQEQVKRAQWKLENQRRRHNYVPLCIQLLKELARTPEQWNTLIEAAKTKHQERVQAASSSK